MSYKDRMLYLKSRFNMDEYKINVTQEDIHFGVRGDCGNCPVARAVIREMGILEDDNIFVNVESNEINIGVIVEDEMLIDYDKDYFNDYSSCLNFISPQRVIDFIEKFDAGEQSESYGSYGQCEPFSFVMKFDYETFDENLQAEIDEENSLYEDDECEDGYFDYSEI